MSVRSTLYTLARILGDLNAIRRGRIAPRLINKAIGRNIGRFWR